MNPIHASCVAIGGRAVLIEGASGTGKSDLALRLIDRGALLVSDDYTLIQRMENRLFASPPPTIAGRIEIRGVGIVPLPFVASVPIALAVTLDDDVARFPETGQVRTIEGVDLPQVALAALEPSAAIKLEHALIHKGLA